MKCMAFLSPLLVEGIIRTGVLGLIGSPSCFFLPCSCDGQESVKTDRTDIGKSFVSPLYNVKS